MKTSLIESMNNYWEKSNEFGIKAEIAYDSAQAKDGEYTEEDYHFYTKRSAYYHGKVTALYEVLTGLGLTVIFKASEGEFGTYHAFN